MTKPNDANTETAFENAGAVEQDRPGQETNVAPFKDQLDHRWQDPLNKQSDAGKPERGQTPEFSGEPESVNELEEDTQARCAGGLMKEVEHDDLRMKKMDVDMVTDQNAQNSSVPNKGTDTNVDPSSNRRDPDGNNPEGEEQDQDPGERQKKNQGEKKDDDLAA